jgi:hypothetical protein
VRLFGLPGLSHGLRHFPSSDGAAATPYRRSARFFRHHPIASPAAWQGSKGSKKLVPRASGEAVELPDQNAIDLPVPGGRHESIETGAPFFPARHGHVAIVPDDIQTDDPATIPRDVHIYVRSVRGDSLAERNEFEPSVPLVRAHNRGLVGSLAISAKGAG